MTRSRNNKHEKRTLKKKKKNKIRMSKRKSSKNKRKRTKKKRKMKINLQIGGNIEPIMARLLHTLERDVIEYLPSTKVVDTVESEKHYLEMVDYIKLQEIINNNENFKKSPKIRKLFDYDLYEINNKDMYFVYKDFKCENIFKDVDKYYIYILYFYLMECNITRNDKIQQGGQETIKEEADPEPIPEPNSDPIPESVPAADANAIVPTPTPATDTPAADANAIVPAPVDPAPVDPAPSPAPVDPAPAADTPAPSPAVPAPAADATAADTAIVPAIAPAADPAAADAPAAEGDPPLIPENIPEITPPTPDVDEDTGEKSLPDDEPDEPQKEDGNEEDGTGDVLQEEMEQNEMEKKDEPEESEILDEGIELVSKPGYERYEQKRSELNAQSDVVNGSIKITNSDLIKYKVNWFKVCMGIDIFDTGFENKVNSKLEELGIRPFKRDIFLEKVKLILDDKNMTSNFKNAIYERLMENCKEPEDFINNKKKCEQSLNGPLDKFLGLFRKCHEKDMKDNGEILYLYDKYRTILNQNTTIINNVDMILIILNCEIRQRILSYHISIEIIRRRNRKNKSIQSILENIYEIDKPVIKQVEDELRNKLAQEKIERMKLVEQVNRKEIEMRKEQMLKKRDPELINAILEKKRMEQFDGQSGIKDEGVKKYIGVNDRNTDNFIDEHNDMLKNETFIGGADPEGVETPGDETPDDGTPDDETPADEIPDGDETPDDENKIYSEILNGSEEGTGKTTGNKGVATRNVRAAFCKGIVERGSIKASDIHKGELINSCGSF
jgi:hypothetical protein